MGCWKTYLVWVYMSISKPGPNGIAIWEVQYDLICQNAMIDDDSDMKLDQKRKASARNLTGGRRLHYLWNPRLNFQNEILVHEILLLHFSDDLHSLGDSNEKSVKRVLLVFDWPCFLFDWNCQTLLSEEEDFRLFSPTGFAVLPTSSPTVAADRASTRLACKVWKHCFSPYIRFLKKKIKSSEVYNLKRILTDSVPRLRSVEVLRSNLHTAQWYYYSVLEENRKKLCVMLLEVMNTTWESLQTAEHKIFDQKGVPSAQWKDLRLNCGWKLHIFSS